MSFFQSAPCDVLVCPLGGKSMAKEKLLISLTKDLWNAGLRADILHQQIQVPCSVAQHVKVI